jgi:hypothetical protein
MPCGWPNAPVTIRVGHGPVTLGVALVHRQTDADRDRGQTLLAEVSEVFLRRGYMLAEVPLVDVD